MSSNNLKAISQYIAILNMIEILSSSWFGCRNMGGGFNQQFNKCWSHVYSIGWYNMHIYM